MGDQVSGALELGGPYGDAAYGAFLDHVRTGFLAHLERATSPLFTTDAADLWGAYLDAFGPAPADGEAAAPLRVLHTCQTCRRFVERYGGLVTLDADGVATSALWHEADAPEGYKPAIAAMARRVRRAQVTGVFLASESPWGRPETGAWHHLAVTPPASTVHVSPVLSALQGSAAKAEDFKTLLRALDAFTQPHVELALTLLKTEALYRSEKVLGQAEWLFALQVACAAAHGSAQANVVWRAVATAPPGFCHPRSSMIGTLLEDIAAGMEFGEVSRRFAAKMHPLSYQRPQAAPSAGQIAAAEKLVETLRAAGALERRFARLDELQAVWRPAPPKGESPAGSAGGVFGHLKPKGPPAPSMTIPAQTMTWDKFQRTVLPTAERMEFCAPSVGTYTALVTAVNADAPPILQWDREDARNPVSWYVWHGGSTAASFGLTGDTFVPVDAVSLKPSMWNGGHAHQGAAVIFVLAGARESKQAGAALFPEFLKSEFHGIRAVLEAYSRGAQLQGLDAPHAAGVMLGKGDNAWAAKVRVWSGGKSLDYCLDRWD